MSKENKKAKLVLAAGMLSSMAGATEGVAQGSIGQVVSSLRKPGSVSTTVDPTLDPGGTPLPGGVKPGPGDIDPVADKPWDDWSNWDDWNNWDDWGDWDNINTMEDPGLDKPDTFPGGRPPGSLIITRPE